MIFGAHVIVSSNDATADRAFFRDVLGFSSVDAGHDWLISALPPAEMAVHPAEGTSGHELYLMSDDLNADMAALKVKDVQCSEIEEVRWGSLTRIQLPGGGVLKLYQAKHPSPWYPLHNNDRRRDRKSHLLIALIARLLTDARFGPS